MTLRAPAPNRWWCPDCDKVLTKPNIHNRDGRFHSPYCREATRRVSVALVEVTVHD